MQDRENMIIINSFIENDPLSENNLDKTLDLVNKIRLLNPQKSIWIYSGYTWEECQPFTEGVLLEPMKFAPNLQILLKKRNNIISNCDVLVDGRYIDSQRDITLPYRGSTNQRLVDIQKSLQKGEIVLWQI